MRSQPRTTSYLVVSFALRSGDDPEVTLVAERPDPWDPPVEGEPPDDGPPPSARERAARLARREEDQGCEVVVVEIVGVGPPSRARVLTRPWPTRLRRLRRHLGITQQGLALRLTLSWQTVAKWETGLASPPPWHRAALHRLEAEAEARRRG